jgi:heme-degrading monooxygenase HmoA
MFIERPLTSVAFVLIVQVLASCANDDAAPKDRPEPDLEKREPALCAKGELEPDMTTTFELAGPGVDSSTRALEPGNYHVAATYLALQPEKTETALELSGPVIESLFTTPGFVAVTTGASVSCNTLRTLTVWGSEEAMFAFVVNPAHARAMAQTSDVSRGTSNTTTWDGNAESVTWQEAARQLGLEVSGDI